MCDIEKAKLYKMVEQGVAVPIPTTHWATPVVFSPKKDRTIQLCVDYRRLNSMNIHDAYLILRMDECIDCVETRRSSVP